MRHYITGVKDWKRSEIEDTSLPHLILASLVIIVPMRLNLFLLGLCTVFLFLSLRLQEESISENWDAPTSLRKIQSLKREFIKNHRPLFQFSLEKLPQFHEDLSLMDPKMGYPRTHQYPYGQIKQLFESMKTCQWENGYSNWHPTLLKAVIWHRFMCEPGSILPEKFFRVRPLIHPFGSSYAYLAYKSGREPYSDMKWLINNRGKLHVSEMEKLLPPEALSDAELVGRELGAGDWGFLLSETDTLISKTFILLRRKHSPGSASALPIYDVYDRYEWNGFFATSPFKTAASNEGMPIYAEGNLGYELNSKITNHQSKTYLFLALGSVFMLGMNLLRMMVGEIRKRVRAQQERLFILQTLTHELRTPVSSMKLSLEPMRGEFEQLPQNSQRAFLRMTEGLSRLKRVIEASTQYLKADGESGEIAFAKERLELRFWLECIVEEYQLSSGHHLSLNALTDVHVDADPYWLEMCIQNLLDNAFKHGKTPVILSLTVERAEVTITVEDGGDLEADKFKNFLNPFQRASKADGLGLGLTLVHRVVSQMGGQLRLETNPTRISLVLKELA